MRPTGHALSSDTYTRTGHVEGVPDVTALPPLHIADAMNILVARTAVRTTPNPTQPLLGLAQTSKTYITNQF